MSGPYCESCKYFDKSPLVNFMGECNDSSKIIYIQCGDSVNSRPEVGSKNECSNYQSKEKVIIGADHLIDITDDMSGCELKSNIESIGYKNIARYSDIDELLEHFSTSDLIDTICNDKDRDIYHIIKELFYAEIQLNSENEISLRFQVNNLLSKIFK